MPNLPTASETPSSWSLRNAMSFNWKPREKKHASYLTQVPFLANATHQWDVHTSFKSTYHNISLKAQTHKVSKWVEVSNCKMVSKCLQAPPTPTVPMAASSSSSKLFSVVRALLSLVRRSSMASSNLYSNMQLAPPSCGRAWQGSKKLRDIVLEQVHPGSRGCQKVVPSGKLT